jgi:AGZA family xanthine/uracil permease-like MFS transporter
MLIGAQAFHESPRRHAPALVLALIPPIAAWGKGQIDMALAAAGTSAATLGTAALGANGVLYHGLAILGSGATLAGIILASIVAMVIDRRFLQAAGFALAGAVFTFCGIIHGEEVRLAASPELAAGYALVAVILCLCAGLTKTDSPAS